MLFSFFSWRGIRSCYLKAIVSINNKSIILKVFLRDAPLGDDILLKNYTKTIYYTLKVFLTDDIFLRDERDFL